MSFWSRFFTRRKRMMEALDQDIRDFIERETQDNIERGLPPEEARYAALRKFGNVTRVREETWELWSFVWLEQLWQDVRVGLRILRKSSGFTAVAVLTLALGIGANTAIFSVINALVLRTLPIHDPGRLVELLFKAPGQDHFNAFDWRNYEHYCENNHVFSGLIAASDTPFTIHGDGLEPETVRGGFVSTNYFSTLGVIPALGRLIGPEDGSPGSSANVAAVSWSYWQTRFDSDRAIVPERLSALVSGLFGALGALLAAVGVYGLLAYTVAQRINEIGIRIAIGATRTDIARIVFREVLGMSFAGLMIGGLIAYWGKRFVSSLIPGLPAQSMVSIVFGAAVMLALAVVAAYVPVRRATKVDPMVALRYE